MSPGFPRSGPPENTSVIRWLRWPAVCLAVAIAVVGLLMVTRKGHETVKPLPLEGYQHDVSVLTREYQKFHGRQLHDPELEQEFRLAGDAVARKNYTGAIDVLETISKTVALPIVFSNLGTLYAASGDRPRTIGAFREVLARDAAYRPVRESIERLKWFTPAMADPVRREIEPNNTNAAATLIAIDTPVDAEIALHDTDVFRFITPAAPRDILRLEIANLSPALELGIRVYDAEVKNDSGRVNSAPGESLTRYTAQSPNTQLFLHVEGFRDTVGNYKVTIRPLKAFDAYEPNDDIFGARKIALGQTIDANIMDSEDTDFYSFESPRTGTVSITIRNESKELIPAITTFNSDQRNTGFGPEVKTPGANLQHTMKVQQNQTYFVQVWSQSHSFGKYSLTLQ